MRSILLRLILTLPLAQVDNSNADAPAQLQRFLDDAVATEVAPGEQYAYSDTAYVLLGQVIEQLSGRSLAAAVREQARLLGAGADPVRGGYKRGISTARLGDEPAYVHSGFWGTAVYHLPDRKVTIAGAVTDRNGIPLLRQAIELAAAAR